MSKVHVALDWTGRAGPGSRVGAMQSWLTRNVIAGGFSRCRVYVGGIERVELYADARGLIELRDAHGVTVYRQQVEDE